MVICRGFESDVMDMLMSAKDLPNTWLAFKIPRSKGLYKVGPIGIEKVILHLRYEAIGNHAVHKLGASIALAWR